MVFFGNLNFNLHFNLYFNLPSNLPFKPALLQGQLSESLEAESCLQLILLRSCQLFRKQELQLSESVSNTPTHEHINTLPYSKAFATSCSHILRFLIMASTVPSGFEVHSQSIHPE